MLPQSPTCSRKSTCISFRGGLFLLINILLLGGSMTAQETRESQEKTARKLVSEAFQLKGEGSVTSLAKAIENDGPLLSRTVEGRLAHSVANDIS